MSRILAVIYSYLLQSLLKHTTYPSRRYIHDFFHNQLLYIIQSINKITVVYNEEFDNTFVYIGRSGERFFFSLVLL